MSKSKKIADKIIYAFEGNYLNKNDDLILTYKKVKRGFDFKVSKKGHKEEYECGFYPLKSNQLIDVIEIIIKRGWKIGNLCDVLDYEERFSYEGIQKALLNVVNIIMLEKILLREFKLLKGSYAKLNLDKERISQENSNELLQIIKKEVDNVLGTEDVSTPEVVMKKIVLFKESHDDFYLKGKIHLKYNKKRLKYHFPLLLTHEYFHHIVKEKKLDEFLKGHPNPINEGLAIRLEQIMGRYYQNKMKDDNYYVLIQTSTIYQLYLIYAYLIKELEIKRSFWLEEIKIFLNKSKIYKFFERSHFDELVVNFNPKLVKLFFPFVHMLGITYILMAEEKYAQKYGEGKRFNIYKEIANKNFENLRI